jgi:hypothetical protein
MVTSTDWIPGFETFKEESPPSLDEILNLKRSYTEYFRTFHGQADQARAYFFEQNEIPVPEGHDPVHISKARATINTAADHVDITNFDITVPLASPRAKARAERLTKFYQGFWLQVNPAIKRTAVKHAFGYGVAWIKTMWLADKWPDAPQIDDFPDEEDYKDALDDFMEQRNIHFPIDISVVDPRKMVWDDSRLGPKWAMEFSTRSDVRNLHRRYPEWTGQIDSTTGIVNWIEYWDDKWAVYIINNEVVFAEQHGYGFMPYAPVLPSFGLDYDDGPPHERYQGILDGNYEILDEINRTVSAQTAILRAFAWPTIDFVGPPHLVEETKRNYELFGGLNTIPTGVSVIISPRPTPPPEMMQHLQVLESQYEEGTFPNIVRGVRPRGVSSGFQVSVLAGMGRLVFQPVADAMARAISLTNSHAAMLVENKAKGKITVHARTEIHSFDQAIGPDDIRGYYENKVVLKAESPEEREREAMLAIRLLQAGVISLHEAMRRSGIVNPLEMEVDILAEQMLRTPETMATLQQILAQRINLIAQLLEATDTPAAGGGALNMGQFQPGEQQLQGPGQTNAQGARMASLAAGQGQPTTFPRGLSELGPLGALLGTAPGGGQNQPNGQVVR